MIKRILSKTFSLILAFLLLSVYIVPVYADEVETSQAEVPTNSEVTATTTPPPNNGDKLEIQENIGQTQEEMLDQILKTNPEDATTPIVTEPQHPDSPYIKKYSYSSNVLFSGIFDTNSYYFKVQNYWECQYAYARVQFTLSQLIQGDDIPASLTFSVNGNPVASYKVDYNNGREQTMYVEIPVDMLNVGFNSFDVTGYVRIYDDEGCIDDLSGANWINLDESSFVAIGYDLMDANEKIKWYPYPYMSSANEDGSNTVVAISNKADNAELEAALLIRADLSNETDVMDTITLTTTDNLSNDANRIIISKQENLPSEYQSKIDPNNADLNNGALIHVYKDEKGFYTMLVVSSSDIALTEAAMLLIDEDRVSQEDTNTTYVATDSSAPIKEQLSYISTASGEYTVEGLTGGGLSFIHWTIPSGNGYIFAIYRWLCIS